MREDVERLRSAFASGRLLHPVASVPSLVDLARALATLAAVPRVAATPAAAELAAVIGPSDHIVFVLIDGLGANALEAGTGAPFLRQHLGRRLLTPFPSTTAVALTSLATGAWPAQHGVTGWWTYLPEIEATVTPLPFTRRGDDGELAALGVTREVAFPLPSMWLECPRGVLHVQPASIVGTPYSEYQQGSARAIGYGALREAFDVVRRHVLESTRPTFTYLYLPHVDAAAHQHTMESPEARGALANIDAELAKLSAALGTQARLVITSDHGHAAVPEERRHRLRFSDALASYLRAMPSGDMRRALVPRPPRARAGLRGRVPSPVGRRLRPPLFLGAGGAAVARPRAAVGCAAGPHRRLHGDITRGRCPGLRLGQRRPPRAATTLAPLGTHARRDARTAGDRLRHGPGVRWDGPQRIESAHEVEAIALPSGVTHLKFSRRV